MEPEDGIVDLTLEDDVEAIENPTAERVRSHGKDGEGTSTVLGVGLAGQSGKTAAKSSTLKQADCSAKNTGKFGQAIPLARKKKSAESGRSAKSTLAAAAAAAGASARQSK
jgi:hypothetical protein